MKSIARRDLRSCIVSAITRASPARPRNNRILRLTSAAARAIAAPLLNATDAPSTIKPNARRAHNVPYRLERKLGTVPNFVRRQNCARPERANAPHIKEGNGLLGSRLLGDQDQAEVRRGLSAGHSGVVERLPMDRCWWPFAVRTAAHSATDALGPRSLVGEGHQGRLLRSTPGWTVEHHQAFRCVEGWPARLVVTDGFTSGRSRRNGLRRRDG